MLCPLEMHQLAVATVQCWVVLTWLLMHVIVTWVVILLRLLAPRIQQFLDLDPRPTSMVVLVIRERACEADLVMVHARHPVALPAGMDTAAEVATYTHSPAAAVLRLAKAQAICLANELHLRSSTTCLMYTATGRANASSQSATRVGPHCCRRLAGADSWSDYPTATLPRKALANISISEIPTYSRRPSRAFNLWKSEGAASPRTCQNHLSSYRSLSDECSVLMPAQDEASVPSSNTFKSARLTCQRLGQRMARLEAALRW